MYVLEHRYQDSGWMRLDAELFEHAGDAYCRASELSEDAICYGMVRVVELESNRVMDTFAAGTGRRVT